MSKKEPSRFSGKPLGIECHEYVSTNNQTKGKSPVGTITVGVDLAKQVFSVCVVDGSGRVGQRCDLKRDALAAWLVQLPPGSVVAMEACSGAHNWARRLQGPSAGNLQSPARPTRRVRRGGGAQ